MVSKKDKYLVSAQKFVERGQLDKALAEYAKVVQEDPKETRTWLKMAEVHAKRGANAEATEIYLRTGDLYVEQGFAQKALAVYKNVLKLSPGTVPAHLKVGALFHQLGLGSDAVQQFEAAAAALQRADKPAEAVAALRQAVDIQPDNVILRVKLAEGASQAGLIDEAVQEFSKAADQLKAQGRADESLRVVERLLFLQPDNVGKARELAEAYIAKGTPRLALPKLQACLNEDPNDPRTLSLLARALEQLGQIPKALSVLKELVRLCEDLGRSAERDAAVLRGLTLDPNDADLVAAASRHRLRSGRVDGFDSVTPPPLAEAGAPVMAGGSFDLSGAARVPQARAGTSASGRVIAPVGSADSERRDLSSQVRVAGLAGISAGSGPDVSRILAEADVFVKYGLLERAADHLIRVFDFEPDHHQARERLIGVLQRLGRKEEAARHGEILAQQSAGGPARQESADHAQNADLDLDIATADAASGPQGAVNGHGHGQPHAPLDLSPGSGPHQTLGLDLDVRFDVDPGEADDPAANVMTPPPVAWPPGSPEEVDERRQEGEGVVPTEFDAEVLTGDVLAAADAVDTPPLVRTPMVITSMPQVDPGGENTHQEDDEDPAAAFSEEVATVVGDAELVATAFAEFDEEELSAELEQVSFYLDQAMLDEARALLRDLEERFPGDARVAAKAREAESGSKGAIPTDSVATSRIVNSPTLGSTVIERPSTDFGITPTPRAVVRDGDVSDYSTHADLAIAYKGMGLFDAAIAELKLLALDPKQEVFALTTMGECFESKGSFTEAIIRYKRALNCEDIAAEENRQLYFLLGGAFERLGDISEALYFYEKVLKRDPKFRDVDLKVAELRPRLVKRAR